MLITGWSLWWTACCSNAVRFELYIECVQWVILWTMWGCSVSRGKRIGCQLLRYVHINKLLCIQILCLLRLLQCIFYSNTQCLTMRSMKDEQVLISQVTEKQCSLFLNCSLCEALCVEVKRTHYTQGEVLNLLDRRARLDGRKVATNIIFINAGTMSHVPAHRDAKCMHVVFICVFHTRLRVYRLC